MKLEGKKIAFGLTSTFYAFKNTIKEMKNIILEGGKIIPIMPIDTYTDNRCINFANNIEDFSKRKIILSEEEADSEEADILVIAPCSRKSYCKTCIFYI